MVLDKIINLKVRAKDAKNKVRNRKKEEAKEKDKDSKSKDKSENSKVLTSKEVKQQEKIIRILEEAEYCVVHLHPTKYQSTDVLWSHEKSNEPQVIDSKEMSPNG